MSTSTIRLTSLSSCAGCAAKLSQAMLADVLRRLGPPLSSGKRVIVDASNFDDAGVYQLRPDLALVQTVDFFTPIVDDPTAFGAIAATNALSDVYAMGGRPVTAMNLLGVPADKIGPALIAKILKGGAAKVAEAKAALVGGHTIKTAEPIFGLSVTGLVHPKKLLVNTKARPGDVLILTKPLGTGILTTAIKRGRATPALQRQGITTMSRLNTPGADLAEAGLVQCATDVTGFGLTGHLGNIVRASGVTAQITVADVPAIAPRVFDLIDAGCVPGGTANNLQSAESFVDFGHATTAQRTLLADAQTSGPLLLCVRPRNVGAVLSVLKKHRTLAAAVIGTMQKGPARIIVK